MCVHQQWTAEQVRLIVKSLQHKPGALLPILHEIHNQFGYIAADAVPIIAENLLLTRAEVHGVISFYNHFRSTPPGKHTIEICRAEACQAMGARKLEQHAKQSLNIDYQQTTADRTITLEPVYCLGNCATAPSIRIDDAIHGRVTLDRFDDLVSECRPQVKEAI